MEATRSMRRRWGDEESTSTARTRAARLIAATAAAALSVVALSPEARACGGLFCDRPPDPFAPLPVAQTGENVVFAIEKDQAGGASTVTAEIQILYTGDAAQFSWVVPVDSVPTFDVGTDQVFAALAGRTQPTFTPLSQTDGTCIPDAWDGAYHSRTAGPSSAPGAGAGGNSGSGAESVNVAFRGVVGPYDTAVIQSTDPNELKNWLTTNGYVVPDGAAAIIDAYVSQAKYFVALKLLNGKDVTSIRPIILTFRANEACVPLRLTAIAANPDMPVRLWVFADSRAVPKNFFELTIDELRIDWQSSGSNYNMLLGEAADSAGGNAFVAEYAGPASIASGLLWSPGQFDLAVLQAAQTPPAYVQALIAMGLANDTQTLPLLRKYIPMPAEVQALGVTDSQFYGNLSSYYVLYAFPPFDPVALTEEISASIIEPRHAAQTLMDKHSYLTRLNTFISPVEMSKDAIFILNPDLPDVSNTHTATFRTMCGNLQFMACNAPVRMELADGRMAWVRKGTLEKTCRYDAYDLTGLQGLPAAEVVWQREASGQGTKVTDNTAKIQEGLKLNNNAFRGDGCACSVSGAGLGAAGLASLLGAVALLVARRRK